MEMNDLTNANGRSSDQRHRNHWHSSYQQQRDVSSRSDGSSFRVVGSSGPGVGPGGSGAGGRLATDVFVADHGTVGIEAGARSPSIIGPSTSSTVVLSKKTSGYSLKQAWRLKYQDFLPEKNSKHEPFQKVIDRANEWLQRTPEIQVRSCETITWTSHDAKRITDGEQMLLTQNIEENGVTHCVRGLRLWLTPSTFGKSQTIYFADFMPTATNDIRSLLTKVNRKLSQNQLKELKDFIPLPLDGDSYEGFETLTERANAWLKELEYIVHASYQSILVQKGDGPHEEIGYSCRFSVPGTNSSRLMEVFRILRVIVLTTGNSVAVDRQLIPDSSTFRPFVYDVFTPELIRKRNSTSNGNGTTTERMETMKDTFSKVMAYLKNTGADVICAETVINPIQCNYSDDQLPQSSPDVVPFLLTIRLFLIGHSAARLLRSTIHRRGSANAGSAGADGLDTPGADSDAAGVGSGATSRPLFLSSVVSRQFKYRWLILALFGFSGMTVIVALSVIYSNKTYN